MNKNLMKLVGIAVLGSGLVLASSQSIAGVANTKHNLGTGGTGTNHLTAGTAEICVFCHTPHGARTDIVAPLWNKATTAATGFATYDTLGTVTLDGAVASIGSVSIACLSCHDGGQAMDTVINAPGSGVSWTVSPVWTGANQTLGVLNTVANLGTDLKNDHPVSIQYGGGGVTTLTHTTNDQFSGTLGDTDFVKPYRELSNGKPMWWVETGGGSTRNKTDMQLYTRTPTLKGDGSTAWDGANGAEQPFVECATCHDPHVETATFLRISNDNSAVCLACHTK